jgi:hypothetical protein
MAKMYAWSNFVTERNEAGQATKTIKPGDAVSQADLGVEDEEWEYLVETGAVREEEYPDIPDDVSPAEYQKQVDNATIEVQEARLVLSEIKPEEEEAAPKATQAPAAGATRAKE